MEQIRNFKELLEAAKQNEPTKMAVIAPHDKNTILAIKEGMKEGLIKPYFFGNENKIKKIADEVDFDTEDVELIYSENEEEYLQNAIDFVKENTGSALMKGQISTPKILKYAFDKTNGINAGRLASHVVVIEVSDLDRLIIISDGGVNVAPDIKDKIDITKNCIDVAHSIGVKNPKVALLAAIELVNPNIQATVDAACISKMCDRGQIKDATVDGPLAFDNAISEESARKKGIKSKVAGKADVLIVPTIEVGNVLGKSMAYIGKTLNAGIVVGAKAPIVLPSRAGKKEAKLASIALSVLIGRRKSSE